MSLSFSNAHAGRDYSQVAELCRQVALKLDWLGRYQDRIACTNNLDAADTYIASKYILNNQLRDANALLNKVIILTNFSIDIGCYGQEDLKDVLQSLKDIQVAIN